MSLKIRFQFPRGEFTGPNIIFHNEFTHEIRKWTHARNIENHLLKLEYNSDTNTTVVTFPSDKAVLLFVMTWTSKHKWCTQYKVLQE
jgi:hypothetical protein